MLQQFGGADIQRDFASYSNIFFASGHYDPWRAGAILKSEATVVCLTTTGTVYRDVQLDKYALIATAISVPCACLGDPVVNITASPSVISVIIAEGAHHAELRYPEDAEPPSVTAARNMERDAVKGACLNKITI